MTEPRRDLRFFRLSPDVVAPLRRGLPEVAVQTIAAITAEVPAYTEAFAGALGAKIEKAVRAALGTFLELVSGTAGTDSGAPLTPALEAAYALGRGEARAGRSLDALLAAYRVGARVSWREMSTTTVRGGVGVAAVIFHDPVSLARLAATLNEQSEGRFLLGWLGTVTSSDPAAEDRFTELEVRALTGAGAEQASQH